jgi:hypothetical protein
MPKYRYSGEDRIYHDYGYVYEGAEVEADEAPDFRWSLVGKVDTSKKEAK